MSRKIIGLVFCLLLVVSSLMTVFAAQPAIENELVLITPVSKFIVDAALERFKGYAQERWGVSVKVSASHDGTPTCYGKIVEWNGRPQADIFWGGESALFDELAKKNLLEKLQLSAELMSLIPAEIGEPKPLPIKDPNGYWVGSTLEPYGLIYNPKLLKRLGVDEIKTWDDLLNPKLKGWVAQCTPDRSSSSHASYEVILQLLGWEKAWEWTEKLATNTANFSARSRDVPSTVAKGEAAVGFAVPSYMAFEEVLAGYEVKYVAPDYCFITCEPIAVIAGAKNSRTAQAFIEFLQMEEGQRVFMERGLFPITPRYRVFGAPGSTAERAVEFTGGVRSFFDKPTKNIYDSELAQERYSEVNETFRKRIVERHNELKKK
ncbi:MAG TPA: hypothetical protein DDZ91_13695 [Firmicutes bacterium]|nr:hypothetical protein [Bacillota bacterium]